MEMLQEFYIDYTDEYFNLMQGDQEAEEGPRVMIDMGPATHCFLMDIGATVSIMGEHKFLKMGARKILQKRKI